MIRRTRQSTIEATQWWTTHRRGELPSADRERFVDWLRECPANIAEYLEIASLWEEMGRVETLEGIDVDALLEETGNAARLQTVVALPKAPTPAMDADTAFVPSAQGRTRPLLFAAATLVAALLVGTAALWWASALEAEGDGIVTTTVGEQRSLALADGSVVDLNTRTAIRVQLGAAKRRVELLKGEALFEIARHENRPFVVVAGTTEIHVPGTKFNVHRQNDKTATVTVLEGRVMVKHVNLAEPSEAAAGEGEPRSGSKGLVATDSSDIELTEGQQARIDLAGTTILKEPTDPKKAAAWTDRRLIFEDTTLVDVVVEFNRYNTKQLRVDDPTLATLRLNGVFRPHDPDSLLQYLERTERVRVRELAMERVITR